MIRSKYILTALVGLTLASCTKDPNSPGYEYMPDMYRSASVEAYVDYYNPDSLSAKLPPEGTIPFCEDPSKVLFNMPYALKNTPEDYEKSAMLKNPIPYSEAVVKEGETIYKKMCMHCHGEKGDGMGQIAINGKIEGIPSYSGALKDLPVGKMFHTITYGKGLMGAHAGQLNREERWKVIFWVKALQNGGTYPVDSNAIAVTVADSVKVK
jgi:mono/diheme cytochrome c family protein